MAPGRTHRLTGETKGTIMMDMCLVGLARHLVLNSDRYDNYSKVKSAIRDYVGQMRHRSDPMYIG